MNVFLSMVSLAEKRWSLVSKDPLDLLGPFCQDLFSCLVLFLNYVYLVAFSQPITALDCSFYPFCLFILKLNCSFVLRQPA